MISREEILSRYKNNDKMLAFIYFLEGSRNIEIFKNDDSFLTIISSLVNNNKKLFDSVSEDYRNRKPTEDSFYIYDDLLIFALICGCAIFDTSHKWLDNILDLRKTPTVESRQIQVTLKNIISSNYTSLDNNFSIILTYLSLCNFKMVNNYYLKNAFNSVYNKNIDIKSDFLIVCNMQSSKIINENIELIRDDRTTSLLIKEDTFNKRVELVSNIIYAIILLLLVLFIYNKITHDAEFKKNISDIRTVTGLVGFGIISFTHKWFVKQINKIQKYIYGQKN